MHHRSRHIPRAAQARAVQHIGLLQAGLMALLLLAAGWMAAVH